MQKKSHILYNVYKCEKSTHILYICLYILYFIFRINVEKLRSASVKIVPEQIADNQCVPDGMQALFLLTIFRAIFEQQILFVLKKKSNLQIQSNSVQFNQKQNFITLCVYIYIFVMYMFIYIYIYIYIYINFIPEDAQCFLVFSDMVDFVLNIRSALGQGCSTPLNFPFRRGFAPTHPPPPEGSAPRPRMLLD